MNFIFLDTTNGLTIGLLNESYDWLFFEHTQEKKPSEVVHKKIDEMTKKFGIEIKETTLVTISGPGSYTGMRLSEGIAQIFKLCGVNVVSLFHFEIPKMVGIKDGVWITNAFKGQFFIFEWNEHEEKNYLMNGNDMNFDKVVYSNMEMTLFKQVISTTNLLKENAKVIFQYVVARNEFQNSYYFRTLDEEFKSIC